MPIKTDRRGLFTAGLALAATASASASAAPPAALPVTPQPLPFDPAGLGWMSEKLITSHHANNYAGAVKRLAPIRAAVAALDPATAPGFQWNGLKREELLAWNSMILHELYFAGLAAPAPVAPALAAAIERDFGSMARWSGEFAAMGKALAGGSGWVLLTYSPRERRLANQWASDHSQSLAGATPLLALDMYEHAYQMDWGAKAAAYVDGFMKNMTWAEANRRFAAL